jgi:hypothetical protein
MQDAERVLSEIRRVIEQDPTIHDVNRITVTVEKKSFLKGGGQIVVLSGSVHSDIDKTKVESIARLHAGGREVVDKIAVVH